jgi:hypothetical protein
MTKLYLGFNKKFIDLHILLLKSFPSDKLRTKVVSLMELMKENNMTNKIHNSVKQALFDAKEEIFMHDPKCFKNFLTDIDLAGIYVRMHEDERELLFKKLIDIVKINSILGCGQENMAIFDSMAEETAKSGVKPDFQSMLTSVLSNNKTKDALMGLIANGNIFNTLSNFSDLIRTDKQKGVDFSELCKKATENEDDLMKEASNFDLSTMSSAIKNLIPSTTSSDEEKK